MRKMIQKENKNLRSGGLRRGLTLLEILIALVVFSFASLYISRTITRILKQKKTTEREIKDRRISANILEMLQRDLKGVFLHFDMNFHLNRYATEELAERKNERRGGRDLQHKNFLNPQFIFFGEENLMTFTSLVSLAGGGGASPCESELLYQILCGSRDGRDLSLPCPGDIPPLEGAGGYGKSKKPYPFARTEKGSVLLP